MAQKLFFDPIKLKTGDKVFALITHENGAHLRPVIRVMRFTVVSKRESIAQIDLERAKRQFVFKLRSELPIRDPATPGFKAGDDQYHVEVDDSAPLFKKVSDVIKYMTEEMKWWDVKIMKHDERQEKLGGKLYEKKPV